MAEPAGARSRRGRVAGPRELEASLLVDAQAVLGEAPQWDRRAGCLVWVDILAGEVSLVSGDGADLASFDVGRAVGSAMPAEDGGWLLADADGFSRLQPDGRVAPYLDLLAGRPGMRFNDAKCDPRGRAWAGSLADGMPPGTGTLYRLDPGPVAVPVLDGLTVSNGLGWSPDGSTLWFADSANRFVRGFDYDLETGALGDARRAVEICDPDGRADGLCVDDEGGIWVALWGAGAIHRYRPDGRLDTVVRVPARQVTSCAFGGDGGAALFITTARVGLTAEELRAQPHAGGLFIVEPDVTGPPATPWRLDPA